MLEARQAENSAAALSELCDSLRSDEGDLRARLINFNSRVDAAGREAMEAEAKRTTVSEVLKRLMPCNASSLPGLEGAVAMLVWCFRSSC